MSDTLNALQKIGGVPTLQSGDTVQVNPLAAINSGNQAAMGVYDLRDKQAQQAWGQILQQSTDENGNVDYGKAQHLAAGNPTATMGMMSALKDTSALRTSQFNLNTAQNNSVNAAATAALAEPDDEKMKQTVYQQMMRQVQMGLIPMDKAMAALHNMSTDPATMRQQLETIRVQTLPEQQKQDWIYGTRPAVSAGGSTEFPTVPAPGRGQGPSVQHTLTPGEATALDKIDMGNNQTIQVPHSLVPDLLAKNPGWKVIVGGAGGPPPTPPTNGTIPGAYQPPGTPPAPATPAAPATPPGVVMGNPATPQAVPGPPGGPPGASTAPYTGPGMGGVLGAPRPGASLQGGVPVASINALQPNVGPPGPPSPLVPGDVAAIMAGMRQGAATPAGGTAAAGPAAQAPQGGFGTGIGTYGGGAPAPAAAPPAPSVVQPAAPPSSAAPVPTLGVSAPVGTGERVKADIDAYSKDAAAVTTHQGAINTLQNAYKALQLADTGPGTQNLQAARAFLQSFGIATSATGDQATQWAEAHKYLMDYARTQGGMGGTDLQLLASKDSNASTDIPKPAALTVVRNNIAKERMAIAQVQEANDSTGFVDHTKNFSPAQDQRAYQADIMPPAELKQIEALQKTNPAAFKKFQKSLDIARAHGLISDEDLAAQNQRIRALGR